MRPITLVMQSFGSYGQRCEIDFTRPDQNLFLITGDTGSGKTTIFDAIVFALYGEASSNRNRKDGEELVSQYADIHQEPFVDLTFSETVGDKLQRYQVHRVPRHRRALKRGSGTKVQTESVSLTMPDGTVYPQKETDAKIVEIIGLTKVQFTQVAMIAQGEFMEVLRADSNKKKEIFRKLFRTEKYQYIVDELARRRKEKLSELAAIRTACQTEAGHIEVPEDYDRSGELLALKDLVISGDHLNVTEAEGLLEELARLNACMEQAQSAMEKDYEAASGQRDRMREVCTKAEGLLQSFEQLEKAEQVLAECHEEEAVIQSDQALIPQINHAYELKQGYMNWQEAAKAADQMKEALQEQEAHLPALKEDCIRKHDLEEKADAGGRHEAEQFSKTEERVARALQVFAKLQKAEAAKKTAIGAANAAQKAVQSAGQNLQALEAAKQKWTEEKTQLGDADVRWRLFQENTLAEYDRLLKERKQAATLVREAERQEEAARAAAQAYRTAMEAYQKKNALYNRRQMEFLNDQAGYLAAQLVEGQPCPVCGSLDHPSPCIASKNHGPLKKEDLDALAEEVQHLNKVLTDQSAVSRAAADLMQEKKRQARMALENLQMNLEAADPALKGSGQLNIVQIQEAMQLWRRELEAKKKELETADSALRRVRESLGQAEDKEKTLLQARDTANEKAADARSALAAAEALVHQLQGQRDYTSAEEAQRALETAQQRKKETDAAFARARNAALEAKTSLEKAETLVAQFRASLPELERTREDRRITYHSMLEEKQFSEEQWKNIVSAHPKEEISTLQRNISRYEQKRAAALGARDTARETIGDRKKPDMQLLLKQRDLAEEKFRKIQSARERTREICRADRRTYDGLAPRLKERVTVSEAFTRIDSLYNRLAGKVSGARMDIETFVQRYYLQRILSAANLRFAEMSAGQYELRMVGEEMAGSGKNRGLDLMVWSFITGQEREVRTLSGGESFMAALSLALGMADQIQETSASIHPDIMFIDEGFGSLDDHARDQAVRVLKEMCGSDKLIGIISHVTELRGEIEDQLQVVKDDKGSHVSWKIS
ncbi:MAG: AAA family ATPase [Bilifractor sp.]